MSKPTRPARESVGVKVAKIEAYKAIVVALITALGVGLPAFLIGKRQGEGAAVAERATHTGSRAVVPLSLQGKEGVSNVILVGSGTVYRYLQAHQILEGLSKSNSFNLLPLEGPTGAGVEIFASAPASNTVLLMSAKRYRPEELSRYYLASTGGQSEGGRPEERRVKETPAVFEVYLGPDQLQLVLIAGSEDNKTPPLETYFGPIINALKNEEGGLDFERLATIGQWWGEHYVYTGKDRSATNPVWESYLKPRNPAAWPPGDRFRFWDIIFSYEVNVPTKPRIYLGSEVLNAGYFKQLDLNISSRKVFPMYDEGKPATRGLYLYGAIDSSEGNLTRDRERFKLPAHAKEVLKHVLETLKAAPQDHPLRLFRKNDCLQKQIDYFKLNSDVASVEADTAKRLFTAGCEDMPDK
jgi:hypothetical protein